MVLKARAQTPVWSIIQIALIAFMSMAMTGCDSSKNPLGKPKKEDFDQKLIGLWRGKQEGHDVYLHVVALEPPFMKAVLITYPLNDYHVGVDQYDVYPTVTATDKFLNVQVPAAESGKHDMEFWFAKYDFTPEGRLRILVPDYSSVEEAVKSHKLSGKAWTTTVETNVALNDSSEHLLNYFQSGDTNGKFKEFGTFHRVTEKEAN
jgi:hypothetical protein